ARCRSARLCVARDGSGAALSGARALWRIGDGARVGGRGQEPRADDSLRGRARRGDALHRLYQTFECGSARTGRADPGRFARAAAGVILRVKRYLIPILLVLLACAAGIVFIGSLRPFAPEQGLLSAAATPNPE